MHPTLRFLILSILSASLVLSLSGCAQVSQWSAETFGTRGDLKTPTLAILQIILGLFMLVSLITLIIPGIPGITFIWLSTLIYGLVTGFERTSIIFMGIITALMLLGNVVDNLLMGAGARKGGAPWLTTLATVLAAVIGSFAFPPLGGVIAATLVLFTLEVIRLKDSQIALRSTGELLKGFGCSFVVRFFIGLVMIGLWIAWLVQSGQWLL